MNEAIVSTCTDVVKAKPFADLQMSLAKNAPEILVGVGVAGVLVSTVLACRATLKAPAAAERVKARFQEIEDAKKLAGGDEEIYSKKEQTQDITKASVETAVEFTKIYGIPAVLMAASLFAIFKGHNITVKRNESLAAAFTTMATGWTAYRNRVREAYGNEAEQDIYLDRKSVDEPIETEGKDGKVKTSKQKVESIGIDPDAGMYAAFFDEYSPNYHKSPEMNLAFLLGQQNYFNDRLRINKHVFLNEVFDALGIPRTETGAVCGWVMSGEGDSYIDFGIYDSSADMKRRFVNGDESSILLNFNCDGVIYNKI